MPTPVQNFAKDLQQDLPGAALNAPAVQRNKDALLAALAPHLSNRTGNLLEIGSGTGQHAVHFASKFTGLTYQPTDLHEDHIRSIEAWRQASEISNLQQAQRLDALASDWSTQVAGLAPQSLSALLAINVIHISPWPVTTAIISGASKYLAEDGLLITYGPYKRNGVHTAESNAAFDASLKRMDPDFGVRDIADVGAEAERLGLELAQEIAMPANNLTLVFRRKT
ncbi:MAG: DUF938 domain-containing protein [Filomicrobium sp.]